MSKVKLHRWRRRILDTSATDGYVIETAALYLNEEPADTEVLLAYGQRLADRGRSYELLDMALRFEKLDLLSEEVCLWLMTAIVDTGHINLGKKHLECFKTQANSVESLVALNGICLLVEDYHSALQAALKRLELQNNASAWTNLGMIYQYLGESDESERCHNKALDLEPELGPARYNLAGLPKAASNLANKSFLEKMIQNVDGRHASNFAGLHYALGKIYEQDKNYQAAFQAYEAGANCMREVNPYSLPMEKERFAQLEYFAGRRGTTEQGQTLNPLFILGMPRTGSTLVDRILSAHSKVVSLGEIPSFRVCVRKVLGALGNEEVFVRELKANSKVDFAAIAKLYRSSVEPDNAQLLYYLDKMPQNSLYLPVILRTFPRGKVIYTRRNPMDACFGNFKQLFREKKYPYSYDLTTIGEQYLLLDDLARRWQEKYPDNLYILDHEHLLEDPQQEITKLLAFLVLEKEEACYRPEKNASGVATASMHQVRSPINKSGLGKWRNYEKPLQPLKDFFASRGLEIS